MENKDDDGKTDIGLGKSGKMTLADQYIVFNGKDRQAILGQWETLGTAILARLYDYVDDILTRYGMVLSVRNKKGGAHIGQHTHILGDQCRYPPRYRMYISASRHAALR